MERTALMKANSCSTLTALSVSSSSKPILLLKLACVCECLFFSCNKRSIAAKALSAVWMHILGALPLLFPGPFCAVSCKLLELDWPSLGLHALAGSTRTTHSHWQNRSTVLKQGTWPLMSGLIQPLGPTTDSVNGDPPLVSGMRSAHVCFVCVFGLETESEPALTSPAGGICLLSISAS